MQPRHNTDAIHLIRVMSPVSFALPEFQFSDLVRDTKKCDRKFNDIQRNDRKNKHIRYNYIDKVGNV